MEKEIGRIKKNEQADIIVRIDEFSGILGVTIREYITTDRYTGFTKSGVRISKDDWENFKKLINQISF